MQHMVDTIAKYKNKLDAYLLADTITTLNDVLSSDLMVRKEQKDNPYCLLKYDIELMSVLDIILMICVYYLLH